MRPDTVIERLRTNRSLLEKLGIKSLALFGSVARGEANPQSDVDLLVEFSQPVGLFEFIRVQQALEALLGCPVDLVTPDALRESMRTTVMAEAIDVTP